MKGIWNIIICLLAVAIFVSPMGIVSQPLPMEEERDNSDGCSFIDHSGESFHKNKSVLSQWPPWVLTCPATNIDPWGEHATLRGILSSRGGASSCEVWFAWDTKFYFMHSSYSHRTSSQTMGSLGRFSETITGLERGTTYHFRAVAYNGDWYDQGVDLWFTPGFPGVATLDASQIGSNEARLNGRLQDNGGVECDVWFVYDTISHSSHDEYRYRSKHQPQKKETSFHEKISNLQSGTKYYFRAVAMNDVGTSTGLEKNFTTKEGGNHPPETPGEPSGPRYGHTDVSYSFSTCTVDPDGDKIKYCFDWGDGTQDWTEWNKSGETIAMSHSWMQEGTYEIKVKARDGIGAESEWSPPFSITIDDTPPDLAITKPRKGLYILDKKLVPLFFHTVIFGKITIKANISDEASGVSNASFFVDGTRKFTDTTRPYQWTYDEPVLFFHKHKIQVTAKDNAGNLNKTDEIKIWICNI